MEKLNYEIHAHNVVVDPWEDGFKIYFAAYGTNELNQWLKQLNKVVEDNIGILKVRPSDVEILKFEKTTTESKRQTTPLSEFLDQVYVGGDHRYGGIASEFSRAFQCSYTIDAATSDPVDRKKYTKIVKTLKHIVADPEDYQKTILDNSHEGFPAFSTIFDVQFNQKKAEKALKDYVKKNRMPENYAGLVMLPLDSEQTYIGSLLVERINGGVPEDKKGLISRIFGKASKTEEAIDQLAADNREQVKDEILEILKDVQGPRLSHDIECLFNQAVRMAHDSTRYIGPVADIVLNPNTWQQRFVIRDP